MKCVWWLVYSCAWSAGRAPSILSSRLPCSNETESKGFCVIGRLKNNLIKTYAHIHTDLHLKLACAHMAQSKHRQSLHTDTKKANSVSVGGSVTSTRDDKRQFSSRHRMTLCTCRGWMEIHGWRERERDCVLGLKLAMIPPPRFCKDMQSTCKHTCMHKTNTHTYIFLLCSLPLSICWHLPFILNNYFCR